MFIIINANNKIAINTNTKTNGIHSGENTHHHDQSITFVNLSIRNTTNKSPEKLIFIVVLLFSLIV